MIDRALREKAAQVLEVFRARGLKIATAESCTGGLVAGALTEIAGSSDVLDCGFVTYSNAAKQAMLGVPEATLKRHGAVSAQTAAAMAAGALKNSQADVAVAITGIAGPGGGAAEKPVGLVHFAAASRDGSRLARTRRYGKIGRRRVRERSVSEALRLLELLTKASRPWKCASQSSNSIATGRSAISSSRSASIRGHRSRSRSTSGSTISARP